MSLWDDIRRSIDAAFEPMKRTFDEAEARFKEFDREIAAMPDNVEKQTVVEETRADGSRVVTKTTIRKISITRKAT